MMQVGLIVVGKLDRSCWVEAFQLYAERLKAYCKLNVIEIKEANVADIKKKIQLESLQIKATLTGTFNDYMKCLLSLDGQMITSEKLASIIADNKNFKNAKIVFVIGGSNGVDSMLNPFFDVLISLGKITLPHQLCRIVVLEQIYRSFKIINNELYHK